MPYRVANDMPPAPHLANKNNFRRTAPHPPPPRSKDSSANDAIMNVDRQVASKASSKESIDSAMLGRQRSPWDDFVSYPPAEKPSLVERANSHTQPFGAVSTGVDSRESSKEKVSAHRESTASL